MHGRQAELDALAELADRARAGQPQLAVLFGRRRTGKTFLLRHFLDTLDPAETAYHACSQLGADDEFAELVRTPSIAQRVAPGADVNVDTALATLRTASDDRLLVVVIDEFPYMTESQHRIAAAVQRFWDELSQTRSHLLLILTGSAISTMTTLVSSGGPLYARPSKLMRLEPFDLPTSASFLAVDPDAPDDKLRGLLEARSACGGYPLLLERWDVSAPGATNLQKLAASPLDPLVAMSSVLLLDLPDARGVRSTLSAIGRGVHKYSEIQSRADQRIDSALATLHGGGYIRTHVPIGSPDDRSTRKLYRIADDHLEFYFRVIDPYRQLFEANQGAQVLAGSEARWDAVVQATFEREARADAVRAVQRGAFAPDVVIGEWWTNRPTQAQIDVVGASVATHEWAVAGEAKYVTRLTESHLQQLERAIAVAGPVASAAQRYVWVPTVSAASWAPSTFRVRTLREMIAANGA